MNLYSLRKEGNCTSCSSRSECKLAELKEKGQKRKEERCHPSGMATVALVVLLALTGCSTKNNTAKTRWWHAFNARYNTYFNGSQAFIEGSLEKEQGNKDNYTELIPIHRWQQAEPRLGQGQLRPCH